MLQQGKDVLVLGILCEEVQNAPVTVPNILALGVGGAIWHDHGKFHLVIPQEPSIFWVIGFVPRLPSAVFFKSSLCTGHLLLIRLFHQGVKFTDTVAFSIFKHGAFAPLAEDVWLYVGRVFSIEIVLVHRGELVKVQFGQLILDEFIQALILPALQKLPVQITLNAVMDQVGIDLDGNFLIRNSGVGNAHLFQITEIGWAAILGLAEIVDKFFGNLQ